MESAVALRRCIDRPADQIGGRLPQRCHALARLTGAEVRQQANEETEADTDRPYLPSQSIPRGTAVVPLHT